jgi:glycerol kinase
MKQMMARTDDNRERAREDLKRMMKEMNTKMDANQAKAGSKQEEMLARMGEEIKSGNAEMRSTLDEWLIDLMDGRKETTTCNEATETKLNPGLMQYIEEYEDILKREAAVMPVEEPRKRCRVCNLAAERNQKRKKRPGEIVNPGGSWLPPAGRCPAMQKWHGEI